LSTLVERFGGGACGDPAGSKARPRARSAFIMDFLLFALNAGAGLVLGALLGLERQYRGHPAGLRTNALVSLGAALFVSLSMLFMASDLAGVDPTRIASYVVSGIGFLGGGVILREGFTVRGMNTAATLWCSAAVGSLAGAGYAGHAAIGTLLVLALNIGLRPLAHRIDTLRKTAVDVETAYQIRVVCAESEQKLIRTILLRHINNVRTMIVQGITTLDGDVADRAVVTADVFSHERNDRAMEDVVSRLNIEPGVTSVSWEKKP
jgi:putative Mg2+ transporter-C (MgtC) family protein